MDYKAILEAQITALTNLTTSDVDERCKIANVIADLVKQAVLL